MKKRQDQTRTAAFMSNTMSSLMLQIVNIVVGFIVPHSIIGAYGSATNGLVTSITQLVGYIQLVEAGISSAAVFQLYVPLANKDVIEVSRIVSAAKGFYYKSGGIFTAGLLVLAIVYPFAVDVHGIPAPEVFVLVLALGATAFLDFFTLAKYQVLLTATQHNWVIQLGTIVYKVLYTAVVICLASPGIPVAAIYVAAIGPIILRSLVLIVYAKKHYPEVNFNADAKGLKLDQRWDAFFLQVLGAVQSGAPTVIATFVLGDLSMVSVMAVYLLVANGIQNAINSVTQGTQASFGDVIARKETETLQHSFREFQVVVYGISGLLCGVAIALVISFVKLYTADVADVNYIYPIIGFLAILNVLLYHLKTPQGLLVMSAGLYRDTKLQTSLQTVILIIGAVVFGKLWGVPGILLGCCLSNLYRDFDLMFYIPRKVTHTKPAETLMLMVTACIVCACVAAPYLLLNLPCDTWPQWVLSGAALLAWGIAVTAVAYRIVAPEQIKGLISRITRLLGINPKGAR